MCYGRGLAEDSQCFNHRSQSIPSPQTSKFEMILDQRVQAVQAQTTHLAADYELLSAETTKLPQLVKKNEIKYWRCLCSLLFASWSR
jgi:hypothetical protein